MRTLVLLSDARHPVSGRPHLSRLETQAIGLAASLDPAARGLHAGSGEDAVRAGLGHGLAGLDVIETQDEADPLPALVGFLADALGGGDAPELILAGRRGEGGFETGLVPYLVAERLGLPIVADAVAIRPGEMPGTLVVDQAMAKGARRRVTVRLPAVVTVHPLSPPPRPFAYGPMRRGTIRRHSPAAEQADLPAMAAAVDRGTVTGKAEDTAGTTVGPVDVVPADERPHRARPKLMRTSGTAAGGANLHVGPDPTEAARLILDYLEANGIRRYGNAPE